MLNNFLKSILFKKNVFKIVIFMILMLFPWEIFSQQTWGPHELVDENAFISNLTASWDAYGNRHVAWEQPLSSPSSYISNIYYKRWELSTES